MEQKTLAKFHAWSGFESLASHQHATARPPHTLLCYSHFYSAYFILPEFCIGLSWGSLCVLSLRSVRFS